MFIAMIDMPLIIVICMGIVMPLYGAFFFYVIERIYYKRRRRLYRHVREELSDHDRDATIIEIVYEPYPPKFYRWRPYALGLLILRGQYAKVILRSESLLQPFYYDPLIIEFDAQRDRIHLPNHGMFFRRGLVYWLAIGPVGKPAHLLSPDTRARLFSSRESLSDLHNKIARVLPIDESTLLGRCPNCSYLLAGITNGTCPECGMVFMRPTTSKPQASDDAIPEL